MNCSEFEAALTDLLAGSGGDSAPIVARLRRHAAGCPNCAGSEALIDLAVRPSGARDLYDDPGAAYWSAFGPRLHARIGSDVARRRRRVLIGSVLAAAAVAAVGLLVGVFRRDAGPGPGPPVPAPGGTFRSETQPAVPPLAPGPAIDDDSDDGFAFAEPLDVFADDDPGGLFPEVEQMAPEDAQRLLEWLSREEIRVKKGAA